MNLGTQGQFATRMITRRLGRCWGTIGRIFRLVYEDALPLRITDLEVNAQPDYPPTQRISNLLRSRA